MCGVSELANYEMESLIKHKQNYYFTRPTTSFPIICCWSKWAFNYTSCRESEIFIIRTYFVRQHYHIYSIIFPILLLNDRENEIKYRIFVLFIHIGWYIKWNCTSFRWFFPTEMSKHSRRFSPHQISYWLRPQNT